MNKLGVAVLGLASAAAGVLDLIWGDFETAHQPIEAFGDHIPGREVMACIAAVWLIVAGIAILWRRSTPAGAIALGFIYLIFAIFWWPRFYAAPLVLGFRAGVFIGVAGGVFQQLIVVAGAIVVYALTAADESSRMRAMRFARWTFGLGSVMFGLSHLTGVPVTARFVPKWIPLGGDFWAVLTGIAFVLAGLAILSRIVDVLAARLLALMLLIFSALVLMPLIFEYPHSHIAWGANAYNLAAVGATWIFASSIAGFEKSWSQKAQGAAAWVEGRPQ